MNRHVLLTPRRLRTAGGLVAAAAWPGRRAWAVVDVILADGEMYSERVGNVRGTAC